MLGKVFQDSFVYGIVDAFFKGVSLFTFPLMAYALSIEEYGVTALASSITGLLSIFFIGIHNAVQRYYFDPEMKSEKEAVLSTGFFFLLANTTIIAALGVGIAYVFRGVLEEVYLLRFEEAVLAIVVIIPVQIFTYAQTLLRIHFRKWVFVAISGFTNGLNVALTLYLVVWLKMGVWGFLVGYSGSFFLAFPLYLYVMRNDLSLRVTTSFIKPLTAFAYPFIFAGIAYWLFSSMDRWMLGWLSNSYEVGLYSVALKLTMVLAMIITAFSQAWSPYAFKLYEEQGNYREVYAKVLDFWYYLLVVGGLILTLFASEFFILTTPEEYWPATAIVRFSLAGMIMNGTSGVTSIGISIRKKVGYLSQGAWLSAIINLVLNYCLIPSYGGVGAAVATMASYFFLTVFYIWRSQQVHPIPIHWSKLAWISMVLVFGLVLSTIMPLDRWAIEWIAIKSAFLVLVVATIVPLELLTIKLPRQFRVFLTRIASKNGSSG